jgi:hypothetical protein
MEKIKRFKMIKRLALFGFILAGCAAPLKPGSASFVSHSGATGIVKQSENPKNESKQIYKRTEETKDGKVIEEVNTTIGASQKDTAREIGAKLASLQGVVWLGVFVFLFGIASAFHPILKGLVGGSVTTSMAIAAAGLALIFLPSLLVGHELLILGVAVAIVGAWFLAHRHGKLRGELESLKAK